MEVGWDMGGSVVFGKVLDLLAWVLSFVRRIDNARIVRGSVGCGAIAYYVLPLDLWNRVGEWDFQLSSMLISTFFYFVVVRQGGFEERSNRTHSVSPFPFFNLVIFK